MTRSCDDHTCRFFRPYNAHTNPMACNETKLKTCHGGLTVARPSFGALGPGFDPGPRHYVFYLVFFCPDARVNFRGVENFLKGVLSKAIDKLFTRHFFFFSGPDRSQFG